MKKTKLLLAFVIPITTLTANASVDIATQFPDVYAQVGGAAYINCTSSVNIRNTSNGPYLYVIGTKVCAENKGCYENKSEVKLEKDAVFNNTYETALTPVFNRAGRKEITCFNYVGGNENKSQYRYAKAIIS